MTHSRKCSGGPHTKNQQKKQTKCLGHICKVVGLESVVERHILESNRSRSLSLAPHSNKQLVYHGNNLQPFYWYRCFYILLICIKSQAVIKEGGNKKLKGFRNSLQNLPSEVAGPKAIVDNIVDPCLARLPRSSPSASSSAGLLTMSCHSGQNYLINAEHIFILETLMEPNQQVGLKSCVLACPKP